MLSVATWSLVTLVCYLLTDYHCSFRFSLSKAPTVCPIKKLQLIDGNKNSEIKNGTAMK